MAFDTTRRGFLKGLMAAAAIPIVAPLMPMEVVAEEVLLPNPVELPPIEAGDFWMQIQNKWEFFGKVRSISIEYPRYTSFNVLGYTQHHRDEYSPNKWTLDLVMDYETRASMHEAFYTQREPSKAVISMYGANAHIEQTFLQELSEVDVGMFGDVNSLIYQTTTLSVPQKQSFKIEKI